MKSRIVLGVYLFTLYLSCAVTVFAMEKIYLTSGEWPPYYSKNLPHGGVANQIITESFAQVGLVVEYSFLPWKRAIEAASHGSAVGSAGWLRTDAREKDFLFSDPVFESMRVLFHRRDRAFDWTRPEDLKDLRVAVTLGSAAEIGLEAVLAQGNGKLDIAKSYASGMKKLVAGRVDVYVCNVGVGLHVLRKQMPKEDAALITYHVRPFLVENNHLIISRHAKDGQDIIDKFNLGLRQLKDSGRYDQIFDEFFLLDEMQ